jgi:hypothetical protein
MWMADSASQFCTLCLEKFTMGNRRHHCRTCGTLCCDLCSAKRLKFPFGGSKNDKSSNVDRVCDSCFNKFVFECSQWTIACNRARKEQLKLEQSMMEASNSKKLLMNSKPPNGGGGKDSNVVMNDTMRVLEERGQRLQEVADKSEQMKEVGFLNLIYLALYFHSLVSLLENFETLRNSWCSSRKSSYYTNLRKVMIDRNLRQVQKKRSSTVKCFLVLLFFVFFASCTRFIMHLLNCHCE